MQLRCLDLEQKLSKITRKFIPKKLFFLFSESNFLVIVANFCSTNSSLLLKQRTHVNYCQFSIRDAFFNRTKGIRTK